MNLANAGPELKMKLHFLRNLATRYRAVLVVVACVVLVLAVRIRLRDMPLERDEGEYAYAGQLMLQGVPPYQEVYNMKLPGTYAAYAGIMAVFGETPSGIHLGVMLVNLASIALVFAIGRKLLDDTAGAVAAVSFALMSLSQSVLGLAGHATHFVTFFALAGTYALLGTGPGLDQVQTGFGLGSDKVRTRFGTVPPSYRPFFAGLLFGLAFLMKQHGVFFGIFGFLYLLWLCLEPLWNRGPEAEIRARFADARLRKDAAERRKQQSPSTLNSQPSTSPKRLSQIAAAKRRDEFKTSSESVRNSPESVKNESGPGAEPVRNESQTSSEPVQNESGTSAGPVQNESGPSAEPVRNRPTGPVQDHSGTRSEPVQDQSQPVQNRPTILLWYGLGFLLPYLLTCLVLWAAGVFPQFWFWTVTYAREYASTVPLLQGEQLMRAGFKAVAGPNLAFWILSLAGLLTMWFEDRLNARGRFFLLVFLVASAASVIVGLYFRSHYFITLLPAAALLSGAAVSRAVRVLKHERTLELFLVVPVLLLFGLGAGGAIFGNGADWLSSTPEEVVEGTYGDTLFIETRKAAKLVQSQTPVGARIAVLGSEPQIYFYSHRRSASGYIYMYPLSEQHPLASRMRSEMTHEIENARPEALIFVQDYYSWLSAPGAPIQDWWGSYQSINLFLSANINVNTEDFPSSQPPRHSRILIFRK